MSDSWYLLKKKREEEGQKKSFFICQPFSEETISENPSFASPNLDPVTQYLLYFSGNFYCSDPTGDPGASSAQKSCVSLHSSADSRVLRTPSSRLLLTPGGITAPARKMAPLVGSNPCPVRLYSTPPDHILVIVILPCQARKQNKAEHLVTLVLQVRCWASSTQHLVFMLIWFFFILNGT